jgi:Rrf2 family protein
MIELAQHEGKKPLQLKIIAQQQGISVKYLEQLITLLKAAGFVRSIRGSKGGYILAKPAEQVKFIEIFKCLEGPVTTTECIEDENYCARAADCTARELWLQVEKAIENVLESVTLKDLIKKTQEKRPLDYQI